MPLTDLLVEEFKTGDKVVMTRLAFERGLPGRNMRITGVVVNTPRLGTDLVSIRRSGLSSTQRYHKSFWRKR